MCLCVYIYTHTDAQLIAHLEEHTKISYPWRKWQPVAPTCQTNAAAFKLCVMLKRTRFKPVRLCQTHHCLVLRISRKLGISRIVVVVMPRTNKTALQMPLQPPRNFRDRNCECRWRCFYCGDWKASWMSQATWGPVHAANLWKASQSQWASFPRGWQALAEHQNKNVYFALWLKCTRR